MKLNLGEIKNALLSRRIITPSGCWEWPGSHSKSGHGDIRRDGKLYRVHVLACLIWIGPKPEGENVQACHRCDNPPCFNPEHLYWGNQATNSADMIARGRGKGQFNTERMRGTKHPGNVLTEADVISIRERLATGRRGEMAQIAREHGVTIQLIYRIKTGKVWGWLKCA